MSIRSWIRARLNDFGWEKLDPVPLEPPVGFQRPLTMEEQVRRLMRVEYDRMAAYNADLETPEDADDFDIEDDPVMELTPYEEHFMPKEAPAGSIVDDASFKAPESGSDATASDDSGESAVST